jgi:hypothetical protein
MQNDPLTPNNDAVIQQPVDSGFTLLKVFMTVFGALFGCIGLVILAFIWIVPFGQNNPFDGAPLFFCLFISCIALAFVGFATLWIIIIWKIMPAMQSSHAVFRKLRSFNPTYPETINKRSIPIACPSCGAKLVQDEQTSPENCTFCGSTLPGA